MVNLVTLTLLLFLVPAARAQEAATPSAAEVLAKSDNIRNPQTDYTLQVKITSIKPGHPDDVSTFSVMTGGRDKTIVKSLSPAEDIGRVTLMLGKDLWVFLPNLSKPLRISLSERLIGEVSNGDIARANFSADYTPRIAKIEKVKEGAVRRAKLYYLRDLASKAIRQKTNA